MMLETGKKNVWDEKYTGSSNYRSFGTGGFQQTRSVSEFGSILLVFTAAIMKADGRVLKSELNYVKLFFVRQFGEQKAQVMLRELRDTLERPIDLRETGHRIRYYMQYQDRLQLLHYLFGIANADNKIETDELNVINRIASYMGVNAPDFQSIKAMFIKETGSDYKILEIDKNVSDEEVKFAYRKMAKKYHPDKVAHLGEEVKKGAEEKFRQIQTAYDNIKKERGI